MYEPLEVVKCKKCGKVIAEPKELIRIVKSESYG
jgi:ribosomal protein S27E